MRIVRLILFSLCGAATFAFGADEVEAPGYRATYPMQGVEIDHLSISGAKSRKGHYVYSETNANINTPIYGTPTLQTTVLAGVRNIHQRLGSKIRPENTLYGVIGLHSEYSGVEEWAWSGGLDLQPDLRFAHLRRSVRYIPVLHGRYQFAPSTGLHVGFYAELGMRASFVRPVIGIDYTYNAWLLQAVFPIKYGITYQGISKHLFSCMIRPFYTAVHTKKGLDNRPAITRYEGTGAEFRWDFLPTPRWNLWLSVGSTLCGNLTVGDKNNNHRHHIHLHQAPYWNIGVTFGF